MKADDLLSIFPKERLPWLFESVGAARHQIAADVMNPVDVQLAAILKFRPASIQRANGAAWAKLMLRAWRRIPVATLGEMLGQYFLCEHTEFVGRLYDALGAEHEDAELSDEAAMQTIESSQFIQAYEELSNSEKSDSDLVGLAIFVIATSGVAEWRPGATAAVEEIAARRTA